MRITVAFVFLVISVQAQSPWPGQASNPVGYAAYGNGVLGASACGAITSGSAGNPTIIQNCKFSTAQSISQNYVWFIQVDFAAGTGGTSVSGSNVLFLGCRFQSNSTSNYNVQTTGANIYFLYSSFTPLTSFYTSPPGYTWPTAGTGANSTTITTDVNATNGNSSYEYGLNITSGGPVYVDHCDMWSYQNGIVFYTTTQQMTVVASQIHDTTNPSPEGAHSDAEGYINSGAGPNNVLIQGNVLAMLGNTNAVAWQGSTSGVSGINHLFNYISGDGYTVFLSANVNTALTNSSFYGNVLATDVMPEQGPLHSVNLGTNTTWSCNTISFLPGTTWTAPSGGWTPTSGMNGQYWLPNNGTPNSSTDNGSNTVCVMPAPSSLDFGGQPTSTTSAVKSITISCPNTAACTFSSIALTTGTQFSISSNNCGSGISAGASCTVNLTFTPTSQAVMSDTLVIASNNPAPANSLSVPVVGVGGLAGSTVITAPNANWMAYVPELLPIQ